LGRVESFILEVEKVGRSLFLFTESSAYFDTFALLRGRRQP
jgi:hypothetical protein